MTRKQLPSQMQDSEGWHAIRTFYLDLIEKHAFDIGPMLAVVSFYSSAAAERPIYPSTSHAALGLSTADTYADRLTVPMVYINCLSTEQLFEIHYQRIQGDTQLTERSTDPTDAPTSTKILDWLTNPQIAG